jgi:type I restriction enzyme, S subunit
MSARDWKNCKLEDIAIYKTGKLNSNAAEVNGIYPFFTCSPETLKINSYAFDCEAAILAGNNANGVFCLKYYDGKFDAYQRTYIITTDPSVVDVKFLFYQLDLQLNRLQSISHGTATKYLTIPLLNEIEVNLPSIATQIRIAAILSALDDKIELNRQAIAQAIFKQWFVDFRFPGATREMQDSELGPIPKGWRVGRLDDVLVLQRGFDLQAHNRIPGENPVVAASGQCGKHNEFKVKGPGVVTGRSGVLGKVFYVHEDYWPLNTALWIKEFRNSTPAYAFYFLKGLDFNNYNAGSAVPALNRNHVHNLTVLMPPKGLIRIFDEIAIAINEKQKISEDEIQLLATIRDTLLPKLMSGEIEV